MDVSLMGSLVVNSETIEEPQNLRTVCIYTSTATLLLQPPQNILSDWTCMHSGTTYARKTRARRTTRTSSYVNIYARSGDFSALRPISSQSTLNRRTGIYMYCIYCIIRSELLRWAGSGHWFWSLSIPYRLDFGVHIFFNGRLKGQGHEIWFG